MTFIILTAFITVTAWIFWGLYVWVGLWGMDGALLGLSIGIAYGARECWRQMDWRRHG